MGPGPTCGETWSSKNFSSTLCTVALDTFNLAVIWCWESFSELKGAIDGNIGEVFDTDPFSKL